MKRGEQKRILDYSPYVEAEKKWVVELQHVEWIWYSTLVSGVEPVEFGKGNIERLKKLKELVNSNIEKRFIYFIVRRQKVRFAPLQPEWSGDGQTLTIYLLIGRDEQLARVKLPIERLNNSVVETTSETITFSDGKGNGKVVLVHDFLDYAGVKLGIPSYVEYVGKTKNPENRPSNGNHAGLNKVMHKSMDGDSDVFLYFNLFKVTCHAKNKHANAEIVIANSLSDEISAEKEGDILEKAFIEYFDSDCQTDNRDRERGELRNNLKRILSDNKIEQIDFSYSVKGDGDYYLLGSSAIAAQHDHSGKLQLINGEIKLSESELFKDVFENCDCEEEVLIKPKPQN